MDDIKKDIKSIEQNLNAIDKTLVRQEENLKQHMYRTNLAERRLEHIEAALEPVKKHVNMVAGGMKLLAIIATVLGILKVSGVI